MLISENVSTRPFKMGRRPYFGRKQIRDQKQLAPRQKIRICNTGSDITVIISRGPYKECGQLKIDYQFHKGKKFITGTILLEDYSVIRNQNGNWNFKNWLERA